MRMKSNYKIIFITLLGCMILYLGLVLMNSYFGWYGYEKWKYRRVTFGNKIESVKRKVFIKDLEFYSSIDIDSFHIFIERGYKYGYHSAKDTRLLTNNRYPYQLSYKFLDSVNMISYEILNKSRYDSTDNVTVFLKKPYLKDTLKIGIYKYSSKKWDSIGYLKVWDKSKLTN
ncbi:hypothetical protein [Flavobacterium aquiphilum]|uniref:hypothetical protein n=1 Tax=Flavobacterium aquiphilum TaxID=3003261 RepID=UPI002480B5D6|nr:hypothetical protein [Flavobacterium aquiphilum]